MRRNALLACVLLLLLSLTLGCGKKTPEGVTVYLEESGFRFFVTELAKTEEGQTRVSMEMEPVENQDGKIQTGMTENLKAGALFLITPYLIVDGQRLDPVPDSALFGLGGTEKGGLAYRYTFLFDTQQEPQELWLCPSGREEDTAWHYQLSVKDFSVIRQAEITK